MNFTSVFGPAKPLIAVLHLLPLPGAPRYEGSMVRVLDHALRELDIFKRHHPGGIIVENFRDTPFYPARVPAETVAALTCVAREVVRAADLPVGINVLRNDGEAAVAIATATGAQFVRINVHVGVVVSEQGIIEGSAHRTLRLRTALRSSVLILADVDVKHSAAIGGRGIRSDAQDAGERGLADGVIVSGARTGAATRADDIAAVRDATSLPVLVGSGVTPDNIDSLYSAVDGFIVGSYFKTDGISENFVDEPRVQKLVGRLKELSGQMKSVGTMTRDRASRRPE
jgi:membrane complex biogenesis BtpA family protein